MYVDFGYRTFSVVIRFGVKNTRTCRDVNGTYNGTAVNVTYIGSIRSI